MKTCPDCKCEHEPVRHMMKSGAYRCSKCQSAYRSAYYQKNKEKMRERARVMRSKHGYGSIKKYREENPEKYKAGILFREAVKYGRIKKEPCVICGDETAQGHHKDYSKPLDVVWLCSEHHGAVHRKDPNICKAILEALDHE